MSSLVSTKYADINDLSFEERYKKALAVEECRFTDVAMNWLKSNLEYPKHKVLWIWSRASNRGKSTFASYLEGCNGLAISDFRHSIYAYNNHDYFVFDVPRSRRVNFRLIKELSEPGMKSSSMYRSRQKMVHALVVVLSNFPPPHEKLPGKLFSLNVDGDKYVISPPPDITL